MKHKIARAVAALLASGALTVGVGAATASAAVNAETSVAAAAASAVNLSYRGSYWNYYDCDVSGFSGVYYGYWTGYLCQWSNSRHVWDLYAG
jgi:hypothetical protein